MFNILKKTKLIKYLIILFCIILSCDPIVLAESLENFSNIQNTDVLTQDLSKNNKETETEAEILSKKLLSILNNENDETFFFEENNSLKENELDKKNFLWDFFYQHKIKIILISSVSLVIITCFFTGDKSGNIENLDPTFLIKILTSSTKILPYDQVGIYTLFKIQEYFSSNEFQYIFKMLMHIDKKIILNNDLFAQIFLNKEILEKCSDIENYKACIKFLQDQMKK